LKTVLLDDADDTPNADWEAGLAELLRDDLDCGVRIEEAVADDLANDLVGTDRVAFGARLARLESCDPMFTIEFKQLKISLFAEAKLLGGLGGAEAFALAFDEHDQAGDDEVIGANGKLTGRADDAVGRQVELHGLVLQGKAGAKEAGWPVGSLEASTERRCSLLDYGVLLLL
jgi:hypothetical protein